MVSCGPALPLTTHYSPLTLDERRQMNRVGLALRVVLAFLGALAASRAVDGKWEAAVYSALIAGLTTAEAYVRDPSPGKQTGEST